MTAPQYFPSLSPDGWIESDPHKADNIFSQFFLSNYSQSQLYRGNVSSFAWVVQEGTGDMNKTASLMQSTLSNYFSRYFTNVTIDVTWKSETTNSSRIALSVYIGFTGYDGKAYSLGKIVNLLNMKVTTIINMNNG